MGNHINRGSNSNRVASHGESNKTKIDIPETEPGYSFPESPLLNVDDIRPPIPWYQDDEKDEEFDWSQLHAEHGHTGGDGNSLNNGMRALKTPRSVLTASSHTPSPLANRSLTTPYGRAITFIHKERGKKTVLKRNGSAISSGAVSLHSALRRSKTHPDHSQLSFTEIDEHARRATKQDALTFTDLVYYLKEPVRFHHHSELMIARAIIVWLANQKSRKSLFMKGDTSTPTKLLQLVVTGKITHADAYAVICRAAGLQCVVIDGVSKPDELEPLNDQIELLPDKWTAVNVEGDWQIVHPHWMCKSIAASSAGVEEWINRERQSKGKSRSEAMKAFKEIIKGFINEDYFMPAPEVFIHSNYPKYARWQLLSPEYTIESKDEFLSLPFIFPAFFRLGLRLDTDPNFVLHSNDGKCIIWISTEFNNAHRLTLTYDLHLLSTHYDRSEVLLPNLKRQGLYCRHNDMFVFEIRFPVEGYFKLELYGGYHRSHSMKLCYFKLVCEKSLSNFRYLPYYTENLMWGPGPACEEHGLVLPSKPTGIVIVDQEPKSSISSTTLSTKQLTYKPVYIVFNLHAYKSKDKVFTIKMYGYDPELEQELATPFDENGELVDKTKKKQKRKKGDIFPETNTDYTTYAECERDDLKKQLKITVQIPHEGEFVLVIKASSAVKDVDGKITVVNDAVDVCVYLLRTSDDPHRENVPQKLARKELIRSMQGTSSNVIKQAVDKCLKVKIDKNDGDIAAAQTKAEFLAYRKAVFDAIHRRNFRIINEELLKLSKYKHSGALASEIRMLFTLRKQLNMLIELTKHIPELQRAAADLVQIEEPSPEVHLTMGALFLLLEEPDKYLDNWGFIVKQFKSDKKQGGESPIIRKMHLVAEMYPPKNTRRKINTLLTEYSFEQVKHVSTSAAKFHVWVQKVMAVLQDLEFDIEFPSNIEAADDNLEDENAKETTDAPETTDAQETTDVDTVQNSDNKSKEGDTKEDNILAEHDT